MDEILRPEYRFIRERQPHCPVCKERLSGNNSIALPYKCKCGTWKQNISNFGFTVIAGEKDGRS